MSQRTPEAHHLIKAIFLTVIAATLLPAPSIVENACGKGSLERGEELFLGRCAKCHGASAVGKDLKNAYGGWTRQGRRIPPALNGTGHAWNHSTKELHSYIKNGSIDKSSSMRPHKELLSDYEIICIIQYIKALWPEEIREKHRELLTGGKGDANPP